jgi:hypothetical protein
MAREYPTYIYTNETEAKSKGEFIVRTVKPRYIAKVVQTVPKPSLLILEWIDDPNETKGFYLDDYKKHALAWYTARHPKKGTANGIGDNNLIF